MTNFLAALVALGHSPLVWILLGFLLIVLLALPRADRKQ